MTDTVAIAAISGGSAVLGGAIGAGAAHWTTLKSQKLQAAEEHGRNRITLYQELLASVHKFMQTAGGIEQMSDTEWAAWFRDYETKHSAVLLLGKKKARKAALVIFEVIGNVLRDTPKMNSSEGGGRHSAYLKHEPEMLKAYDEAVKAMREDVGAKG
jgi:hypothetical protein